MELSFVESTDLTFRTLLSSFGRKVDEGPNLRRANVGSLEFDVWKIAPNSLITEADVRGASLTPTEGAYVEAMRSLATEDRTTSRIAALLGKKHAREVSPTRQSLIDKGVIEAPAHGLVAFTVFGFGEHQQRDSTRHRGLGFR